MGYTCGNIQHKNQWIVYDKSPKVISNETTNAHLYTQQPQHIHKR